MSSEHAEKFDKFATSSHVKYKLQKQVWKGSKERHGKRREENEGEKHKKNEKIGKEMEVKKRKNKRKWEKIEAKKNQM